MKYPESDVIYGEVGPYVGPFPDHDKLHSSRPGSLESHPHTFFLYPVKDRHNSSLAFLYGGAAWDVSLRNLLPSNVRGIMAIISNDCNQSYTYEIDGIDAFYIGDGDLHLPQFDDKRKDRVLSQFANQELLKEPGHCIYRLVSET